MNNLTYLTTKDAAKFIGLSESTLAKWRMSGDGPRYIKSGSRKVLYSQADLIKWLESRGFENTTQYS